MTFLIEFFFCFFLFLRVTFSVMIGRAGLAVVDDSIFIIHTLLPLIFIGSLVLNVLFFSTAVYVVFE